MKDYSKLVKVLRWCCDNCLYLTYKHDKDDYMDRMLRDAADAIESLQKELDAANYQLKMYSMCPFEDEEEEE